jgi:hypothetical protein
VISRSVSIGSYFVEHARPAYESRLSLLPRGTAQLTGLPDAAALVRIRYRDRERSRLVMRAGNATAPSVRLMGRASYFAWACFRAFRTRAMRCLARAAGESQNELGWPFLSRPRPVSIHAAVKLRTRPPARNRRRGRLFTRTSGIGAGSVGIGVATGSEVCSETGASIETRKARPASVICQPALSLKTKS